MYGLCGDDGIVWMMGRRVVDEDGPRRLRVAIGRWIYLGILWIVVSGTVRDESCCVHTL